MRIQLNQSSNMTNFAVFMSLKVATWQSSSTSRCYRSLIILTLLLFLAAPTFSRRTSSSAKSNPQVSSGSVRYVLDPAQSKFIAHAFAGGLFWFKGHDHYLAARQFSGEVGLTPQTITPASLHLVVKADSLEETGADFTAPQKEIINKEVRDIVSQPAQYPEIVFQSTNVTSKPGNSGRYEVEIAGNLTLHGVTKPVKIPVTVTLSGDNIRAVGRFSIDRGDFKVKATSAFHGLVRVRDNVRFEFEIVGHKG